MLLSDNYGAKLRLEASVILVIPFIIVVLIIVVVLLSTKLGLLTDATALDRFCDVACRLAVLVMMMMRRRGGDHGCHGSLGLTGC